MTKKSAKSKTVHAIVHKLGRVVTGYMIEGRSYGIQTDGDGIKCEFGCPIIFWSVEELAGRAADMD